MLDNNVTSNLNSDRVAMQWHRRKFLRTLVLATGITTFAGALAACSDTSTATSTTTTASTTSSAKTTVKAAEEDNSKATTVAASGASNATTSAATDGTDVTGYTNLGAVNQYTKLDAPKAIVVDGQPGYIFYQNQFYLFSNVCTHKGCTVGYDPEDKEFECPCHGSKYDLTGMVTHGPAQARLPFFSYKIVNNTLYAKAAAE